VYFFLGVAPAGVDPSKAEPNHSPRFMVNEDALVTGVRALASVAADYLVDRIKTESTSLSPSWFGAPGSAAR